MATRLASIWRLLIQPGSRLISPNSPNATVFPRWAMPLVRPLNVLRNLIRFGASMPQLPVLYVRPAMSSITSPLKIQTLIPIVP